jgi:hypothetical protein
MRKIFVVFFLFLLLGCEGFDIDPTVCRESVYHDYSVKGDFLLDHGERIVFTPKCYYEKSSPKLKCGLAVLGVETRKIIKYSTYGMSCPSTEETAIFNYDSTDFSKVIVVTSKDSSKSILSYTHILSKDEFSLSVMDVREFNDKVMPLTILNGFDSELGFIESDSLGIVDFSLKDVRGTRVHVKLDFSANINYLNSGTILSDSGITLLFDSDYDFLDEECNMSKVRFTHCCDSVKENVITNAQMKMCLTSSAKDNVEIPLGILPWQPILGDYYIRDYMLKCESEPEIQDSTRTFRGDLEIRCKSLRVVFYRENLFYKE